MPIYKDVSSLELVTYTVPKDGTFADGVDYILEKLDAIHAEDVEPVKHAHWEKECRSQIIFPDGEVATLIERKCSNCHLWSDKEIINYYPEPAKRCSNCGAKMDDEEQND